MTSKHSIDFGALERGSVISRAEIERHCRIYPSKCPSHDIEKTVNKLRFATREVASTIERYFLNVHGDVVTVASNQGDLIVLDPVAQDKDCIKRIAQGIRKICDAAWRDQGNDTRGFSDERLEARRKRQILTGWRITQLMKPQPPKLTDGEDRG